MRRETNFVVVIMLVLMTSAISQADNIYVSCYNYTNHGMIEKFDSSGNSSTFASDLRGPAGLAFGSTGNLYAAIWESGTIEVFDSSGNRTTFASKLDRPGGLAFDSRGNLFVAVAGGGKVMKFDSSGNGATFASLRYPQALAFDSIGNLYVSDRKSVV